MSLPKELEPEIIRLGILVNECLEQNNKITGFTQGCINLNVLQYTLAATIKSFTRSEANIRNIADINILIDVEKLLLDGIYDSVSVMLNMTWMQDKC